MDIFVTVGILILFVWDLELWVKVTWDNIVWNLFYKQSTIFPVKDMTTHKYTNGLKKKGNFMDVYLQNYIVPNDRPNVVIDRGVIERLCLVFVFLLLCTVGRL